MSTPIIILILIAVGYLLGSINSALVVSKLLMGYDIRTKGSGHAGLTNSLRVMGAKPTLFVLVGDIAKGVIACLIGSHLMGALGVLIAGSAAIAGHMFPLYFGFKGGKGVATSGGMVIFVNAKIALILLAVFGVNLVVTRYVSLGSILMAVLYPVMMWLFYKDIVLVLIALVFTLILVIAHRDNIKRLLNGTENKISFGKKSRKTE